MMKERIYKTIDETVTNFLVFDRDKDKTLPDGAIEKAINDDDISVAEIITRFKNKLEEEL